MVEIILIFVNCFSAYIMLLFFAVPWVGLWRVTVAFPDHTHLLYFIFSFLNSGVLKHS